MTAAVAVISTSPAFRVCHPRWDEISVQIERQFAKKEASWAKRVVITNGFDSAESYAEAVENLGKKEFERLKRLCVEFDLYLKEVG